MNFYKYEKDSLSFKKVSYRKIGLAYLAPFMFFAFIGAVLAPRQEVIEKLTPVERMIVIDMEFEFTEEKFIEEIKRMNFKYPHIVLAQSKIETGNFTSRIFIENNNLFGMKQARVRANLATGTQHNHATYNNWKESLYDYGLYYSSYLRKINSEEKYFEYINQLYAEDPNYDTKVRALSKKLKYHFE